MKIILLLLKMYHHPKPPSKANIFASKSKLLKACKKSTIVCALIVLEENKESTKFLRAIKPLLEEFADVVFDEILVGLPPTHNIEHYIDLVHGPIILNMATYHVSPEEHEEL